MRIYTTWDKFFCIAHKSEIHTCCDISTSYQVCSYIIGPKNIHIGSVSQGSTSKSDTAQIAQCSTFFHDPLLASCKTSPWTSNQPEFKALQFQKHNVWVRHWCKLEILRRNLWGAYHSHSYTWNSVCKFLYRQCCVLWLTQLLLQANLLHPAHLSSPHEKHSNEVVL